MLENVWVRFFEWPLNFLHYGGTTAYIWSTEFLCWPCDISLDENQEPLYIDILYVPTWTWWLCTHDFTTLKSLLDLKIGLKKSQMWIVPLAIIHNTQNVFLYILTFWYTLDDIIYLCSSLKWLIRKRVIWTPLKWSLTHLRLISWKLNFNFIF